jgi:epoxide hydrolase 4
VASSPGPRLPGCDRVDKLVILNAPHPQAFFAYMMTSPSQMLKSSYVAFFQLPFLPERVLSTNDHAALVQVLKRSSRPGAFSRDDIEAYRAAWSRPGALTAMLNWYRALPRRSRSGAAISAPTLILWGEKDEFLEVGLARQSMSFCSDARLQTFPEATHWLQREEIEGVNAALLAFLA